MEYPRPERSLRQSPEELLHSHTSATAQRAGGRRSANLSVGIEEVAAYDVSVEAERRMSFRHRLSQARKGKCSGPRRGQQLVAGSKHDWSHGLSFMCRHSFGKSGLAMCIGQDLVCGHRLCRSWDWLTDAKIVYAICMLLWIVCWLSLKVILQYRYMHHPIQSVSQSKCTCKLPNSLELLVKGCEMSLPL